MGNNLMMFVFENHAVEVINIDGKALFNANHVADILDIKNVRDNISKMNERQVVRLTNLGVGLTDTRKLNNSGENFLTESGVYKLVFKSKKPNAEEFQDWIADEVLPQIRQTGGYIPISQAQPVSDDEIMARAIIIATNTIKMQKQQLKDVGNKLLTVENDLILADGKIQELEPKGEFYDNVLKCTHGISISTIADEYGLSGQVLNQLLCDWKIQYKKGKRYFLYQKYRALGFTDDNNFPTTHKDGTPGHYASHMKWLPPGHKFIYSTLREHGYKTSKEKEVERQAGANVQLTLAAMEV